MAKIKAPEPLDFDYERFPGVALRATAEKLEGHALIDRPQQVARLAQYVLDLAGHFLVLIFRPSLLPSATLADVEREVKALSFAHDRLNVQLHALSAQSLPDSRLTFEQSLATRDLAAAAATAFQALLDLLLLLLDSWKSPTSLCWYKDLFDKGIIAAPKPVVDFLERKDRNRVFAGWWVQGNNPICVSRVTLGDVEARVGELTEEKYARLVPGDTPKAAGEGGRLFWVDFPTLLGDLKPGDFPVEKRLPKPIVLFAVKPNPPDNEPFVPLAIFDDSIERLVWSDDADPHTTHAWTRAILASMCANQLHHTFFSHFPRTHFVMEAVAVATLRKLESPKHPLFWLLRNHIDGTLGFNETALSSFTAQTGADRLLMAASLRTGQKMMRRSLDEWKDFDFAKDILTRGVAQLPYYPYRDDAQHWYKAIGTFVRGIVDAAYSDDAAVRKDKQLQDWGGVLAGKRAHPENGAGLIRASPASRDELHLLLHRIIFTCTAYHAAVQVPLNDFDVSPLTAPGSLYPDKDIDPPETMLAKLGTAAFQLAFFYFGNIVTFDIREQLAEIKDIPMKMQPALRDFAQAHDRIFEKITYANNNLRQAVGAYETLLPKNVSRSVDI